MGTSLPLRADWERLKDDVMLRAVRRKFVANPDIREVLVSTGDELLVEASRHDYYWGSGDDGSGKNRLGQMLMRVREEIVHNGKQPEGGLPLHD